MLQTCNSLQIAAEQKNLEDIKKGTVYTIVTMLCYKKHIIEPRHEISSNVVCATSEGLDQPAHVHRLIRAFASPLNIL